MSHLRVLEFIGREGNPEYRLKGVTNFFKKKIESPEILYLGWSGDIFGRRFEEEIRSSLEASVEFQIQRNLFRNNFPFFYFANYFDVGNFNKNLKNSRINFNHYQTGKIFILRGDDFEDINSRLRKHYKKWR